MQNKQFSSVPRRWCVGVPGRYELKSHCHLEDSWLSGVITSVFPVWALCLARQWSVYRSTLRNPAVGMERMEVSLPKL